MVRPRVCRRISFRPPNHYFKPQGVPMRQLKEIVLTREELEAIKLKDFDGLEQIAAAEKMNVSQSTFWRILNLARQKIAKALIGGQALKIEE